MGVTNRSILIIVAVFATIAIGGCCSPRNNCYVLDPETWSSAARADPPKLETFSHSEAKIIRAYYFDQFKYKASENGQSVVLPTSTTDNARKDEGSLTEFVTQPLPSELAEQLPEVLDGYERIVAPSICKVLLVWVYSQNFSDVLHDVPTSRECGAKIKREAVVVD